MIDDRTPGQPQPGVDADRDAWRATTRAKALRSAPERRERFETSSGLEVADLYTAADLADFDPTMELGQPGEYPFTRGVQPTMYRSRFWTMRQYAGFATAAETNERFRYLLAQGQTGLSVAFDLPTQMGYDSDAPQAEGEVGRVGVPISSLADMETLFQDIPLGSVSTSMTINATSAILLALYVVAAERQGVPRDQVSGTTQNDILKEYIARGTYIYPPRPSMRLIVDTFAYCAKEMPQWNTISISGYHIREAGSTAVQEIAFTLANGVAYVEAALAAGLALEDFAPRLSFFFNAHNNLFEEVAKYRAARRLWASIMVTRFGATDPKAMMLRFHTQTGGSTLTAQQPENNIVRVTVQALAAALGGTQSLHTNGFDEALGLPTERAARLALRTQQVLGYESGVADTVDPLAGSYFVESLTNEVESRAREYLAAIEERGGAVAAIEAGYMQNEIETAAYEFARAVDRGDKVVVGVNRFADGDTNTSDVFPIDPQNQLDQVRRVSELKLTRDQAGVDAALLDLETAVRGSANVLYPMKVALSRRATLGEVSDVLRSVFGQYRPQN